MYCMHCGTKIPDGARFCSECGKMVPAMEKADGSGRSAEPAGTVKPLETAPCAERRKKTRKKGKRSSKKAMIAFAAAVFFLLGFMAIAIDSKNSPEPAASAEDLTHESEMPGDVSYPAAEADTQEIENRRIDKSLKPEEVNEPAASVTPLSDFWVGLKKDGHTITLRAYETHDEKCIIPSEYTIDGETWYVTRIDDACFFGRTGLEYLVIPEGVTSIGHNAFNSCTVKEMYLPSTLENIEGIFEYLDHSDRTIYYAGTAEDWWAIQGADGITDNIDLIGDTPVPVFADETDYAVTDLVTHRSNAERLGSDVANALNGLLQGFNDGLEASDDEYDY